MNPFYLTGRFVAYASRFVAYAKRSYAEGLVAHQQNALLKAQATLDDELIKIMRTPIDRDFDGINVGGGYIAAIKACRLRKGLGLKEAKDYIDALSVKHNIEKI